MNNSAPLDPSLVETYPLITLFMSTHNQHHIYFIITIIYNVYKLHIRAHNCTSYLITHRYNEDVTEPMDLAFISLWPFLKIDWEVNKFMGNR
jgi:hypothetical protein